MRIKYRFMRFPEGKAKAVTLSYDDGCPQDIRMADTLTKHGIKCTFNLNREIGYEGHLTTEEIREHMLDKGHEIAVHGAFHRAPGKHRPIEGIRDVLDCRLALEKEFDMIVRGMAYPDSGIRVFLPGNSYETVREYLKDLDIVYSRTLAGDNTNFELPTDWYAWMPSAHAMNPELFDYIDKFLELDVKNAYIASRNSRLFYLWGHSFEFDRENVGWEHLDRICEKLGGHNDIWYATNMEIYNYVEAYKALSFSADEARVYNPTLHTIWFEIDKNMYVIKPGATIKIQDE